MLANHFKSTRVTCNRRWVCPLPIWGFLPASPGLLRCWLHAWLQYVMAVDLHRASCCPSSTWRVRLYDMSVVGYDWCLLCWLCTKTDTIIQNTCIYSADWWCEALHAEFSGISVAPWKPLLVQDPPPLTHLDEGASAGLTQSTACWALAHRTSK